MNTLEYIQNTLKPQMSPRGILEIPNFGRDNLPELFNSLGFKVGAEIGTAAGVYAETLCKNNPGVRLYCIDPWEEHEDFKENEYKDVFEDYYQQTKQRLKDYDCKLIREYSMEAVEGFEDNSLDFVYIDGNHTLPFVINDIYYWSKKVKPGGIIAGHDYIKPTTNEHQHVKVAVKAYTEAYNINPWFVLGLEAKRNGMIRDATRSWMFVKS